MRQLKAEFYKMRHTFLFPLHVIVPGGCRRSFSGMDKNQRTASVFRFCAGSGSCFSGTGICDLRRKHRAGVIRPSAGISYDYGKKRKHFSGKMDEP